MLKPRNAKICGMKWVRTPEAWNDLPSVFTETCRERNKFWTLNFNVNMGGGSGERRVARGEGVNKK